jgi:hypothetical protein
LDAPTRLQERDRAERGAEETEEMEYRHRLSAVAASLVPRFEKLVLEPPAGP